MAFQKIANYGMRTDLPLIEALRLWDREDKAQQEMHKAADESSDPVKYYFTSPTLPPAALWVNNASREEALRFYKLGFNDNKVGVYINYDQDEVLLDSETFGRSIFTHGSLMSWHEREPPWVRVFSILFLIFI